MSAVKIQQPIQPMNPVKNPVCAPFLKDCISTETTKLPRLLTRTNWLAASLSVVSGCSLLLGSARADEPMFVMQESSNANVVVGLEVTAVEDEQTVAVDLGKVFRLDDRTILLASISATKGESDFGMLSAGVAVRRLLDDSQTFIGASVFYDALQNADGFSYSQIGFGAEVSRGRYTLRGNYYMPVGDHSDSFTHRESSHEEVNTSGKDSTGRTFTAHSHRTFTDIFTQRFDAALGWDAELEVALYEQPQFIDPVVAVGYYRVWDDDTSYEGLKARGEVRIGEHLTVGAEWRQNGGEIGQEWRVGARFQFEFGGSRKLTLPVVAMGDGKTMHALEKYDGKSMRPMDGKSTRPPEPQTRPTSGEMRHFLDPVERTPWPNVFGRTTVRSLDPRLSAPVIIMGPALPLTLDCGCKSGPILIFP